MRYAIGRTPSKSITRVLNQLSDICIGIWQNATEELLKPVLH